MTVSPSDPLKATSSPAGESPQLATAPGDASAEEKSFTFATLWDRVHHHKVMHWTLAYAAAAYTLLHGVEMVSGALSWPHVVVRVLTLVLILGVPVVITIAWYHGAKGLQRISAGELVIITFLGIISGSMLWAFAGHRESVTEDVADKTAARSAILDKSIAVLPFTNLSASAEDEYLADGLADTLLRMLAENRQLKVIARTSSFSFKGKNDDVRTIGEKLGVATLLEGSVQRSGDRLRVIAQLVSTKDGAHLWSQNYDRMMTDVFAVQDEIAAQVVTALNASLTPSATTNSESSPKYVPSVEAYQEYLQGRTLLAPGLPQASQSAQSAMNHFEKATALDPAYALAYVGIADALLFGEAPQLIPAGRITQANQAVQRALVLQPDSAEAWATLGRIRTGLWDAAGVDQAYRHAIELNPGYAPAYGLYALALLERGYEDEARELIERAAALDPLDVSIQMARATVVLQDGNLQVALQTAQRVLDIRPSSTGPYINIISAVQVSRGQLDEAIRTLEAMPSLPAPPLTSLERLYRYLGDDASAERVRKKLNAIAPDSATNIAMMAELAWANGDTETAVRLSNQALQLFPTFRSATQLLARIDLDTGRPQAAIQRVRKTFPELNLATPRLRNINAINALLLSQALQATGRNDEAQRILKAAESYFHNGSRSASAGFVPNSTLALARVFALQGRRQEALRELRAAVDRGDGYDWQYWSRDPMFDSIADAPEFMQCVEIVKTRNAKQLQALRRNPLAVSPAI